MIHNKEQFCTYQLLPYSDFRLYCISLFGTPLPFAPELHSLHKRAWSNKKQPFFSKEPKKLNRRIQSIKVLKMMCKIWQPSSSGLVDLVAGGGVGLGDTHGPAAEDANFAHLTKYSYVFKRYLK